MAAQTGCVYLVGAGPGDPGLITVRGQQLLRQADIIVHDRLIPHELLSEVKHGARIIDVGKAPSRPRHSQSDINNLLIEHAESGAIVVRLKGGDPFLFGRGWEEVRACRAAGVPCEVVPGVSSALAVPASADIPVTLRRVSRSLAVVTAQDGDGHGAASLNYPALVGMDTVVVLMGRANLCEVAERFLAAGGDPSTPAACVERGTTPGQRVAVGTLASIADIVERKQLKPPVTTVIGEVVRCALERDGAGDETSTRPNGTSENAPAGEAAELRAEARMAPALNHWLEQIEC